MWKFVRNKDGEQMPKPEAKPLAKPKPKGRPKKEPAPPAPGDEAPPEVPEHRPYKKRKFSREELDERIEIIEEQYRLRFEELEGRLQQVSQESPQKDEQTPLRRGSSASPEGALGDLSELISPESKVSRAERLDSLLSSPADSPEKQGELGKLYGELGGAAGAEQGKVLGVEGGKLGAQHAAQQKNAKTGAEHGWKGGEQGKVSGAKYGHLGGRPKRSFEETQDEPAKGEQPSQWLQKNFDPQRKEEKAAVTRAFQEFIKKKAAEAGVAEEGVGSAFMQDIQKECFPGKKTRDLVRAWKDTAGKAKRFKELELGKGGGKRKHGEHSVMRQTLGMGIRAVNPETANKKSALSTVFAEVKTRFETWRMSGQYVDREDLCADFEVRLADKVKALEEKRKMKVT